MQIKYQRFYLWNFNTKETTYEVPMRPGSARRPKGPRKKKKKLTPHLQDKLQAAVQCNENSSCTRENKHTGRSVVTHPANLPQLLFLTHTIHWQVQA